MIWIAADSQIHETAAGTSYLRSTFLDRFAPAIRPPTLDLWSSVVLGDDFAAMRKASSPVAPVFFLGDAADISCTTEFTEFLRATERLTAAKADQPSLPWFAALGNHDGFYMGNITMRPDKLARTKEETLPNTTPGDKTWSGACYAVGLAEPTFQKRLVAFEQAVLLKGEPNPAKTHAHQRSLSKSLAILMYLESLYERRLIKKDPLDPNSWDVGKRDYPKNRYMPVRVFKDGSAQGGTLPAGIGYFEVRASITPAADNDDREWQGYVVQDIGIAGPLDDVHVLLVDTSDPSYTPLSKFRHALLSKIWKQYLSCQSDESLEKVAFLGECGDISDAQASDLTDMMKKWGNGASTSYFVMGHHPAATMRIASAARLQELTRGNGFMGYVSAHTHYTPSSAPMAGTQQWEINVSSTTDWPMQFMALHYWKARPSSPSRLATELFDPKKSLELLGRPAECIFYDREAELDYGEPEKYIGRALEVYTRLLDWILRTPTVLSQVEALGPHPAFPCKGRNCIDDYRSRLAQLKAVQDRQAWRTTLSELAQYDRFVLQQVDAIRSVEVACAMWASREESRRLIPGGQELTSDPSGSFNAKP
jgi:hypothetical protein